MKLLLIISTLLFTAQTFAFSGITSNKMASDAVVKKALANPKQYKFDDGGNIDFGNGIFVRRFSFSGQPQACHDGQYLYAGSAKKCVKPIYSGDDDNITGCAQYKTVSLKTLMVGTRQICTNYSGKDDSGPCTKYSTVKVNRGPKVKVAIYKSGQSSQDHVNAGFLGFTYLTLPVCNF